MEARFDEIVHAPNRLRICSLLATTGTAEFGTIRDMLGVADSVTSKQLKVLADAGYVRLSKRAGSGSRAKTWATITGEGRAALAGHLASLQELAADAARPGP